MSTRSANDSYGLTHGITDDDQFITGSRLPTYRQVLRCFLFYTKKKEYAKLEAAKNCYNQVKPHYDKGGIKMKAEFKCYDIIKNFMPKTLKQ